MEFPMVRWLVGVVVVLAAGYLLMAFFGFNQGKTADGQEKKGTPFAIDRALPEVMEVPFDGKRAMGYLEAICAIGPRMSGTPGMGKQQDLIRDHFEKLNLKVSVQAFTARQNSQKKSVPMTNLIVSFHPEKSRRIIVCSHYDTRPIADQENDPRKWREPFVSANDGGSGVAFLMELAHHIKNLPLNVGVDFVFFDGEEFVFEPQRDRYFFGSEHFANEWKKNKKQPAYVAAILLDMIAGKNAKFPVEGHSWQTDRDLCLNIWKTASETKSTVFKEQLGERVMDDHLALQNAGIPALDIIDFSYPHWHKLSDTPENCSAEPMLQVAKVLTTWMQRLK
jgi:glutaminyl-peptide cyclotransferase